MKEEFVKKWSNWWILNKDKKMLNKSFEKELNDLISHEILNQKQKCENCEENVKMISTEEICPKCLC